MCAARVDPYTDTVPGDCAGSLSRPLRSIPETDAQSLTPSDEFSSSIGAETPDDVSPSFARSKRM